MPFIVVGYVPASLIVRSGVAISIRFMESASGHCIIF
nr:MAG TPA: hypothetical protein [Caudoviricetes sp.]DAS20326.1 MAG TPA: hypothetical protein [Caudoviricetes sp.]